MRIRKDEALRKVVDPALCSCTKGPDITFGSEACTTYLYGNEISSLLSIYAPQPRQRLIIKTRVSKTIGSYCPRASPPHSPQTLRQSRTILLANTSPLKKPNQLLYHPLTWSTTPKGKKDKDDVTPESSNMAQLLSAFEVYGHATCFFAARPHVALQLYDALARYRLRLIEFSRTFSFKSIRTYHYVFMAKRILSSQDDSIVWLSEDYQCQHYLVPRQKQLQANLLKAPASGGFASCKKFNAGEFRRTNCKFALVPIRLMSRLQKVAARLFKSVVSTLSDFQSKTLIYLYTTTFL